MRIGPRRASRSTANYVNGQLQKNVKKKLTDVPLVGMIIHHCQGQPDKLEQL